MKPGTVVIAFFLSQLLGSSAWPVPSGPGLNVKIAWTPSVTPTVVGYNLYYHIATPNSNPPPEVTRTWLGPVTRTQVDNLMIGRPYFFWVTALDSSGLESDPSRQVGYMVPVIRNIQTQSLESSELVTLIIDQIREPTQLSYRFETTSDFVTWQELPAELLAGPLVIFDNQDGTDRVSYTYHLPSGFAFMGYFRIKVLIDPEP